jgi:SAM-dependent MidA family methyltransferase
MLKLEEIIRDRISADGPLRFRDFMATALYEPGLGYYMREDTEIGVKGDFYTSPHLHPVFGAMMGRQAEECWKALGKPDSFDIVEAGSGRGFLALDLLDYLHGRELYEHLSYQIIEMNPALKKKQEDILSSHTDKLLWHEELSAAAPVNGMILTNELLDALPVHLIVIQDELKEIYVALRGGNLVEEPGPASEDFVNDYFGLFDIEPYPEMHTEAHLDMKNWIREAASALNEGYLLTIDYGFPASHYFSEDRPEGTLLCYYQHDTNEDFLSHIGQQDITAHVNFSALKLWGEEFGLASLGFTRQGPYLVSLGLDEVITEMYRDGKGLGRDLPKLQNLIMAGTMGDTHKVMLQCTKGLEGAIKNPRGFALKNQIEAL